MSEIINELAEVLDTIDRSGDFYTADTAEIGLPRLEVDGVGPIAFPLLPVQTEQLIAVAQPSPYGRGEKTLHDPEVRRTWELEPERVHISGSHWAKNLKTIVERAATGLGVSGSVQADFYKLLIYDEGSFFVDHRDTEKAPGMFATLIIVLPADYSGGELLVRHLGQEARLALQCPEPSSVAFAAFYADCVHEVLPITSGCRLTLVYNLRRRGKKQPAPPDYRKQEEQATALLRQWSESRLSGDDDGPEKLVYQLEHAYTQAEIAFSRLKGADAAVASVLAAAAPQAGCDLHLALLSIEQSGSAEYYGGYGRGRRRRWSEPEDDDFEIGEIIEQSATLKHWRQVDGRRPFWDELPCLEEELWPPMNFDKLEPDEQHFQEASGNAGASFERFYSRAALVLWPTLRQLAVLNQAGLSVTLPYLGTLSRTWRESGAGQDDAVWQMAHVLVGLMLRDWSAHTQSWAYLVSSASSGQVVKMLDSLVQLRDDAHIDTFLNTIATAGNLDEGSNEALVQAAGLLPVARASDAMERIIAASAANYPKACAHLLRSCSEAAWLDGHPEQLLGAARTLLKALPGDPKRKSKMPSWHLQNELNAGLIQNLLGAVVRIDSKLATQTVDYLLAWPEPYDLDRVILPAVLALREQPAIGQSAAVQRLSGACINHLQARIAEPLAPPDDWTRAAKLSCKCADCKALSQFLANPEQKTWTFKAAESRRGHVTQSVKSHQCDLDLRTERVGSPHRLVCTKNQASYQRRAEQREQDLNHLQQLS